MRLTKEQVARLKIDPLPSEIAFLRVRPGHTVSQGDVKGESDATVNRLSDSLNSDAKDAEIAELKSEIAELQAEMDRRYECGELKAEIARLQAELAVAVANNRRCVCTWCGHVDPHDGTPEDIKNKMATHIIDCIKHPIRQRAEEIAGLRESLASLIAAVNECYPQLYSCGYGSREMRHMEPSDWDLVRETVALAQKRLGAEE